MAAAFSEYHSGGDSASSKISFLLTYVKREQDLGIPGLRREKDSYYPNHLVEKVRIILPGSGIDRPDKQQRRDE